MLENAIIREARGLVGVARYQLQADPQDAPGLVDCSSLVKYLYGKAGITLPRLASEQMRHLLKLGGREIMISETGPGDLVFTSGFCPSWDRKVAGPGHVSFAVSHTHVVTAMIIEGKKGVFELPIVTLLSYRKLVCILASPQALDVRPT